MKTQSSAAASVYSNPFPCPCYMIVGCLKSSAAFLLPTVIQHKYYGWRTIFRDERRIGILIMAGTIAPVIGIECIAPAQKGGSWTRWIFWWNFWTMRAFWCFWEGLRTGRCHGGAVWAFALLFTLDLGKAGWGVFFFFKRECWWLSICYS